MPHGAEIVQQQRVDMVEAESLQAVLEGAR